MIPFSKYSTLVMGIVVLLWATPGKAETTIGMASASAKSDTAKSGEATASGKAAIQTVAVAEATPATTAPESDAAPGSDASAISPARGDSWWSVAKAIGATVFVIGLILGAMTLLKRYLPHRFGPLGHTRQIQVLESVPLGEKRMLTLVEVGGQRLLLASSPGNVSLLKELPSHSEARSSVESAAPVAKKAESPATFNQTLKTQLAAQDKMRDPQTLLVRLTQIRQALEAR